MLSEEERRDGKIYMVPSVPLFSLLIGREKARKAVRGKVSLLTLCLVRRSGRKRKEKFPPSIFGFCDRGKKRGMERRCKLVVLLRDFSLQL